MRRVPAGAYVVGVLAVAAGVWAVLQDFEPYLGHEEAVYANKVRSWVEGTPDAGWGVYRPVGLPALGARCGWAAMRVAGWALPTGWGPCVRWRSYWCWGR
ncbi:hypothetical protein AB0P36_12175 [Streptomyces flavidovirens]|uniref:hypothetical protein n=1 Tax=Streptomyces flavidovirens TaxID=67298 RepID=UPI003413430B